MGSGQAEENITALQSLFVATDWNLDQMVGANALEKLN